MAADLSRHERSRPAGRTAHPQGAGPAPGAIAVPAELAASADRMAASRARARSALDRARLRRRMLPPVAVGSVVLIGTAVVGGWVRSVAHMPTTPGIAAAPSNSAASSKQLSLDAAALARLAQTLAAEKRAIAGLGQSTSSAIERATARAAAGAAASGGSSAGSSSTGPGGVATSSGGASTGGGSAALPALPALPSLPTVNIPVTHGSTGASG